MLEYILLFCNEVFHFFNLVKYLITKIIEFVNLLGVQNYWNKVKIQLNVKWKIENYHYASKGKSIKFLTFYQNR